jgi:hypothetical protein
MLMIPPLQYRHCPPPFVVAHRAGHKPPSVFDAPVDGWLLYEGANEGG